MKKEFELARLLIISESRHGRISESRLYAWANRIYPLNPEEIEHTFQSDFDVSKEDVCSVLSLIARKIESTEPLVFYTIENEFKEKLTRFQIISILRLLYIDGRFDSKFWNNLSNDGGAPVEAHGINEAFDFNKDVFI